MMPITSIILHRSFEKDYLKQEKSVRESFKEKRTIFLGNQSDPVLHNHKLAGEWKGYRSINITGDIRAVYKQEAETAIFVAIGSHSRLYK